MIGLQSPNHYSTAVQMQPGATAAPVQYNQDVPFGPYPPARIPPNTANPPQVPQVTATVNRDRASGSEYSTDRSHRSGARPRRGQPRGDAHDSDEGSQADSEAVPRHLRRGRGRYRTFRDRSPRQQRHAGSEEDDDPNDEYATNRERLETHCKSLSIKQFSSEDKTQDFDIWVSQFEEAVNRGTNPHSRRRHYRYCLQWLPGYLSTDAYVIWKRHRNCKDWVELKGILRDEYEDPLVKAEWKNNTNALPWDEEKEPLTTYCSKIKRYVDLFDTEIADVPAAKKVQYYQRFFNGMPLDYQDQITMGLAPKKREVHRALDICIRFQIIKKNRDAAAKKLEVGASVSVQDPTLPSRVTQCEHEILRLKKPKSGPTDVQDFGNAPPRHNYPHPQNQQNYANPPFQQNYSGPGLQYPNQAFQQNYQYPQQQNYHNPPPQHSYRNPSYHQSPHRYHTQSREAGTASDSSIQRHQNRMDRFHKWRGNDRRGSFRGRSPRPFNRQGHSQEQRSEQPASILKNPNPPRVQIAAPQASQGASLEGGFALQSELESEVENLDDTICQFEAQQEQAFIDFCEKKDEEKFFSPGNY